MRYSIYAHDTVTDAVKMSKHYILEYFVNVFSGN